MRSLTRASVIASGTMAAATTNGFDLNAGLARIPTETQLRRARSVALDLSGCARDAVSPYGTRRLSTRTTSWQVGAGMARRRVSMAAMASAHGQSVVQCLTAS